MEMASEKSNIMPSMGPSSIKCGYFYLMWPAITPSLINLTSVIVLLNILGTYICFLAKIDTTLMCKW